MNGKASIFDIILTVVKYVLLIVLIMFFVSRAHEFYDMGYGIFMQQGIDEKGTGHDVSVVIGDEDSDPAALGRVLEGHGLIENRNIFRVQEMFSAYHGEEIAAGTYVLSTEMTPEEMLGVLTGNVEYVPAGAVTEEGTEAAPVIPGSADAAVPDGGAPAEGTADPAAGAEAAGAAAESGAGENGGMRP